MTDKTDEAAGIRTGRLHLWEMLRWELAFIAVAALAFSGWMTWQFGDWRLALIIGSSLLALTATIGFLCRKVLVAR